MFYLLMWFIQGMMTILFKLFLIFFAFFIMSSLSYSLKKYNFSVMSNTSWPFIMLMYISQPPHMFFISASIIFIMVLLLMKKKKQMPFKNIFWLLFKKTLEKAISIREMVFMPDWLYFFFSNLKKKMNVLFSIMLLFMFITYHQFFILSSLMFLILTTTLMGLTISFISNLLTLSFSKNKEQPQPPLSFEHFLKSKMEQHPLNAMIEESFFEDNLQMEDFYLVYPIFFKASHPSPNLLTYEQEILNVWHLIRWESALSKQTGSAVSRWSSLFSLKSMPAQSSIHSMHTPLIPIYSEKLFLMIKSSNLPYFDPFNQPPFWSPYLIMTSFLNWKDDEINEERINEMEEEELYSRVMHT